MHTHTPSSSFGGSGRLLAPGVKATGPFREPRGRKGRPGAMARLHLRPLRKCERERRREVGICALVTRALKELTS